MDQPVCLISRQSHGSHFDFELIHQEKVSAQSIPVISAQQIKNIDILLVCVKSYQLEDALNSIKHTITSKSLVVLMQNGMGHDVTAHHILPNGKLLLLSNTHGAFKEQENNLVRIFYTGVGQSHIGPAISHEAELMPGISQICHQLHLALPPVIWNYNINHILWRKLAVNAVINPLTAILDCNNGELVDNNGYWQQAEQLIEEMRPVIVQYCPALEHFNFSQEVTQVAIKTGLNSSSMRQDIKHKRQTEIDAITGYLLQKAKQCNISLPNHQKIYHDVRQLETKHTQSASS